MRVISSPPHIVKYGNLPRYLLFSVYSGRVLMSGSQSILRIEFEELAVIRCNDLLLCHFFRFLLTVTGVSADHINAISAILSHFILHMITMIKIHTAIGIRAIISIFCLLLSLHSASLTYSFSTSPSALISSSNCCVSYLKNSASLFRFSVFSSALTSRLLPCIFSYIVTSFLCRSIRHNPPEGVELPGAAVRSVRVS